MATSSYSEPVIMKTFEPASELERSRPTRARQHRAPATEFTPWKASGILEKGELKAAKPEEGHAATRCGSRSTGRSRDVRWWRAASLAQCFVKREPFYVQGIGWCWIYRAVVCNRRRGQRCRAGTQCHRRRGRGRRAGDWCQRRRGGATCCTLNPLKELEQVKHVHEGWPCSRGRRAKAPEDGEQ